MKKTGNARESVTFSMHCLWVSIIYLYTQGMRPEYTFMKMGKSFHTN